MKYINIKGNINQKTFNINISIYNVITKTSIFLIYTYLIYNLIEIAMLSKDIIGSHNIKPILLLTASVLIAKIFATPIINFLSYIKGILEDKTDINQEKYILKIGKEKAIEHTYIDDILDTLEEKLEDLQNKQTIQINIKKLR